MGGRGASSGMSRDGKGNLKNEYGSQYKTILTEGNIKFISKNTRQSETIMETMTKNRVYVTVGGEELKSIIYFDQNNKRSKQIDLNHPHKGIQPHTHHGYEHNENDGVEGGTHLNLSEKKLVEKVKRVWDNYLNNRK